MSEVQINHKGRNIIAEVDVPEPDKYMAGTHIQDLKPEDLNVFNVLTVYDEITGKEVKCTKEIRNALKNTFLQEMKDIEFDTH